MVAGTSKWAKLDEFGVCFTSRDSRIIRHWMWGKKKKSWMSLVDSVLLGNTENTHTQRGEKKNLGYTKCLNVTEFILHKNTIDQCWFHQLWRGSKVSFVMTFCSLRANNYLEETRWLGVARRLLSIFRKGGRGDSCWQGKDANSIY